MNEAPAAQNRNLNNLFELALTMSSSLDLDQLLDRLLHVVQEAIGYDSASVFVEDAHTGKYRALSRKGYEENQPALFVSYDEIAVDTLQIMRDTLKPIIIPDTGASPIWQRTEATAYIQSWLGAPLVVRDQVIGVINLNSGRANHYAESDAQLLATIASQASAAIDNARLFAQVQEQSTHLSQINAHLLALQEASLKMTGASTVLQVLLIVRDAVRQLAGEDSHVVFSLLDEKKACFELVVPDPTPDFRGMVEGSIGRYLDGVCVPMEGMPAHVGEALQSRKPLVVHDLTELLGSVFSYEECRRLQETLGIRCVARFVLWSRGRVIGTISVTINKEQFDPDQIDLLLALTNVAAAVVDNVSLLNQLQQTSSALDDIIASSADAIITLDREQHISSWNRAASRIFAVGEGEVLGQPLQRFVAPERQAEYTTLYNYVMAGESVNLPDWEQIMGDGSTVWVAGGASPLRNSAGAITGALITLRDVTQERLVKRQMAQTEKLSALGQLVAGVAHELNNPLTSVIGFAQLLKAQPLDAQGKRDVDRVVDEAQRAARIVRNLLVFARDHEPAWSQTDVNAILSAVLEMRGYEMRLLDVIVEMNLAPDLPQIQADPYQLRQVFLNLVINAEQAMEKAGGRLAVSTRQKDASTVRVELRDSGPGITPADMKLIFDPFYTTKEVGKGTGMGLSICFGIVEEHGGRVWAESEPGQGATFIVELPINLAASAGQAPDLPEAIPTDVEPAPTPGQSAEQRILVVDDEETITDMLAQALQHWGYAVDVAGSGDMAWQLLQEQSYDLVLSDLRMPGMSGQTLLERLQEVRPELVCRVAFMTGDTASEDAAQFLAECGRPTLKKPFALARLQEFVEEMLVELDAGE